MSSTYDLEDVEIRDIKYDRSQPFFYKVSVVNGSTLRARRTSLTNVEGPLLYVSGSTLIFEEGTVFNVMENDDVSNSLMQIDTSTFNATGTTFTTLTSETYSPIINLEEDVVNFDNVNFTNFDKTLYTIQDSTVNFNDVIIKDGNLSTTPDGTMPIVNSMVFDVESSDIHLLKTYVFNIETPHSSPVMYIETDSSDILRRNLILEECDFRDNFAKVNNGVLHSKNTNTTIK